MVNLLSCQWDELSASGVRKSSLKKASTLQALAFGG